MRLLAWNIRQGGGARLVGIMAAIARHDADVLILSEYRGGNSAERLRTALLATGYRHVTKLVPPPQRTGVLIAARRRFVERGPMCVRVEEPWRLVDVDLGVLPLTGVYMPNLQKKVPYWQTLVDSFGARATGDALAIGDFNTCRAYVDEPGAIDATARFMDSMDAIGFRDLWRHRYPDGREFSWYSHRGNGFRIDHAFLSPSLAARAGVVRYSHEERLSGLSDHSVLLLGRTAVTTRNQAVMKFGLRYCNTGRYVDPALAIELLQAAEAAGFESAWTVEHTVIPRGYQSAYPYTSDGRLPGGEGDFLLPDPLIWMAYVAAATTCIKLATGILILPQHNPVIVAKQVATLDHMSNGRILLGIGVGWLKEEFDAIGATFENRGRRTDEYIAAMRELWSADVPNFAGRYVSFKDAFMRPKPVNRAVPIIIGGHTEAAARRAGRLGDGFFPGRGLPLDLIEIVRRTALEAGRDPAAVEITVGMPDDLAQLADFAAAGVSRVLLPVTGVAGLARKVSGPQDLLGLARNDRALRDVMSARPHTILLDLDGTLIDSRPGIAASCAAALHALGHIPDPAFDVTPLIGPPLPQVFARLLARYGDDRVEAGMTAYRAHYGENGLHMATVYPGIPEALRALSVRARCFVVTSKRKDFAARIVASLAFAAAVSGVYGTEPDGSMDDKARLIAAVLRIEGLDPNECTMVGDRSHDVIGAHANGVRAIGVLWGYGRRDELAAACADALVATPGDLVNTVFRDA